MAQEATPVTNERAALPECDVGGLPVLLSPICIEAREMCEIPSCSSLAVGVEMSRPEGVSWGRRQRRVMHRIHQELPTPEGAQVGILGEPSVRSDQRQARWKRRQQ
jgi:hypothetical protein